MNRILELFQHLRWADDKVWQAVLALPEAEDDSRLRFLLHHIHVVQHIWLQVWTGQPVEFPEESSFESLEAIREWGTSFHEAVGPWLREVDEARLGEAVDLPFEERVTQQLGQPPEASTISDTLYQVALHSLHHRAQVTARLRELGGEPPTVDFIAWVWLGRPAGGAGGE